MLFLLLGLIIVVLLCSWLYLKINKLKLRYNLLNETYLVQKVEYEKLSENNKEYIRQCEHYKTKSENLVDKIAELNQIHDRSNETAKGVLVDLGNKLSKQLIEINKKENQESRILSEERINQTTNKFYLQTERIMNMMSNISKEIDGSKSSVEMIKKSLLTPIEVGQFAEITLENILKNSGLIENTDYILQKGISHNDEILRPDSVIFLPGDNIMVIDAKSSKFIAKSDNDMNQDTNLAYSMNKHLESLGKKDYTNNISSYFKSKKQNIANIMTFMFLPTDYVLERVYKTDPSFIKQAWKKQIFPVGPAGLMNVISLAHLQINDAKRITNYTKIIDEILKLMNSVYSLSSHSSKIGTAVNNLIINYDKFARSFNTNFLSKVKNLEKLGLESRKNTCIPLKRYNIIADDLEIIPETLSPIEHNNK